MATSVLAPDRGSDVRDRERWCIVDTVPDHHCLAAFILDGLDGIRLVLGEHLSVDILGVDP